jgi:hypothetical protein
MSIPFHVLVGAAIAHTAASRLKGAPGVRMLTAVALLAVLSHGILDGLRHGYPFHPVPGIAVGAVMALFWILAVRGRLALLFAVSIGGALLPDVVDLGPDILRAQTGVSIPAIPCGHIFPWHWGEGSGSMYEGANDRTRDLRSGRNSWVSYANHGIVVIFSLAGILMAPGIFRWTPATQRSSRAPIVRGDDAIRDPMATGGVSAPSSSSS